MYLIVISVYLAHYTLQRLITFPQRICEQISKLGIKIRSQKFVFWFFLTYLNAVVSWYSPQWVTLYLLYKVFALKYRILKFDWLLFNYITIYTSFFSSVGAHFKKMYPQKVFWKHKVHSVLTLASSSIINCSLALLI